MTKQWTTLEEFADWQCYFWRRKLEHEKIDWYLASVAQTVASSMGGSKAKLDQYLLKFEPPKARVQPPEESKAIWLAALGVVT